MARCRKGWELQRNVQAGGYPGAPATPVQPRARVGFCAWVTCCWKGRQVQAPPVAPPHPSKQSFETNAATQQHATPVPVRRRGSLARIIQPFAGLKDRRHYEELFTRDQPYKRFGQTLSRREILFPKLIDQLMALQSSDHDRLDFIAQADRRAKLITEMIDTCLGQSPDASMTRALIDIKIEIEEAAWKNPSSEDTGLDESHPCSIHLSRVDPRRGTPREASLWRGVLPPGLKGEISKPIPIDLRASAKEVSAAEWVRWARGFGFTGARYEKDLSRLVLSSFSCVEDFGGNLVSQRNPIVHIDSLVDRAPPGADTKHGPGRRRADIIAEAVAGKKAVLDPTALREFICDHVRSRQRAVAHAPQDDAGAVGQVVRLGQPLEVPRARQHHGQPGGLPG